MRVLRKSLQMRYSPRISFFLVEYIWHTFEMVKGGAFLGILLDEDIPEGVDEGEDHVFDFGDEHLLIFFVGEDCDQVE